MPQTDSNTSTRTIIPSLLRREGGGGAVSPLPKPSPARADILLACGPHGDAHHGTDPHEDPPGGGGGPQAILKKGRAPLCILGPLRKSRLSSRRERKKTKQNILLHLLQQIRLLMDNREKKTSFSCFFRCIYTQIHGCLSLPGWCDLRSFLSFLFYSFCFSSSFSFS